VPRARVRYLLCYLTTLPASLAIVVCMFLPHTRDCHARVKTPVESGLVAVIAPVVVLGLLPLAWRMLPRLRAAVPELVLAVTAVVMAIVVIGIPVMLLLIWRYSRGWLRGERLTAVCSACCVAMFLFWYPLLTMSTTWLAPAIVTWNAAIGELVGLVMWASAARDPVAVHAPVSDPAGSCQRPSPRS
jgi:hypothetical protein